MGIVFAGKTNIGHKRQVNEDSFWPESNQHDHQPDDPYGLLFIVADGMGGHGAGNIASSLAVKEISTTYYGLPEEQADIGDRLTLAIQQAHQQIREQATLTPGQENMGTTVAAVVVKYDQLDKQGEVWVAWAGDSRVYLLRQQQLKQLTRDHSKVWSLIEAGQITWDELRFHPERSRVTNALTARRSTVTPEVEHYELEPGDLLLLCSDGLSGEVRPEEIEQILATYLPQQVLSLLIDKANGVKEVDKAGQKVILEGGNDNITAVLIEIPDGNPRPLVSAPTVVAPQAAPARPPRLGLMIAGVLAALGLVGAGLFLAFFGLGNAADGALTAAGTALPTETIPAAPTEVNPGPAVIVETVRDKATLTATPESTATEAAAANNEARTPTVTREPISSPTLPPTRTPRPTATATFVLTPTLTITTVNPADYSPPRLLEPEAYGLDQNQHDAQEVRFVWEWPGELTDQLSFEIRVWLQGEDPQGAYDAKELRHNPTFKILPEHQYEVTLDLSGSPGVTGTSPNYLWSVSLVQIEPEYKWFDNLESEKRRLSILVSDTIRK